MKTLITLLLVLSTSVAYADINTSGLTPEQKAKLQLDIEKLKNQNNSPVNPEQFTEYVKLGEAIGSALSSTAKELGVAVNDLSKTPVGKITMCLIVWKVAGSEIIHFVVGSFWLVIFLILWCKYFKKICILKEVQYNEKGKKSKEIHWGEQYNSPDGTRFCFLITLIIGVSTSFIVIFTG